MERTRSNIASLTGLTLRYATSDKELEAEYGFHFICNGQNVELEYDRFDNPYVEEAVQRKAEIISFRFDGHELTLNFEEGTREQK